MTRLTQRRRTRFACARHPDQALGFASRQALLRLEAPGAVQPAAKVRGRERIYWHARFQRYTKIFCDSVVIEHSMSGWQFAYAMRFHGTQVLLATRSEIIPWSEVLPVMRNAFFSP